VIVAAANKEPGLSSVFTTYHAYVPQLFLKIDREKTQTFGVSMNAIFTALQSYLGFPPRGLDKLRLFLRPRNWVSTE